MKYSQPLGASSTGSNSMQQPICFCRPERDAFTSPPASLTFSISGLEQDVMSEPHINNKAKGAEWADSSDLWREIPARDSCPLRSSSHVFHPPSLTVMTVINDPQLPCASSLTPPSFFLSYLHAVSPKRKKNEAKKTIDATWGEK